MPKKLTKSQLGKLKRLLNMKYKPSELAEEIGCSVDTVYHSYIPAGCPHERDKAGLIWIVGTDFVDWATKTLRKKSQPMNDNQAFCMRCHKPVEMINSYTKPVSLYLEMVIGQCAECSGKVLRGRARNDQS